MQKIFIFAIFHLVRWKKKPEQNGFPFCLVPVLSPSSPPPYCMVVPYGRRGRPSPPFGAPLPQQKGQYPKTEPGGGKPHTFPSLDYLSYKYKQLSLLRVPQAKHCQNKEKPASEKKRSLKTPTPPPPTNFVQQSISTNQTRQAITSINQSKSISLLPPPPLSSSSNSTHGTPPSIKAHPRTTIHHTATR